VPRWGAQSFLEGYFSVPSIFFVVGDYKKGALK
jgi:hypothetical protein